MIDQLLNALIPLCIAGSIIIGIILISIGGAMIIVWLLGGLWHRLFGERAARVTPITVLAPWPCCAHPKPWRFSMHTWGCANCGKARTYWGDEVQMHVPPRSGEARP